MHSCECWLLLATFLLFYFVFQGYVDSTRLSASVSDVRRMSKSTVADVVERGNDVTTSPVASAHRGYVLMANHNWISLFRERAYTR